MIPKGLKRMALIGPVVMALTQMAAAAELVIEEIVVTATKRAESVQDVPVAVNAVDAETIEAMRIDEFTDITLVSPSLTMNRGDWATNSGYSLRGIGTNVFSLNIEPSVAIVVDDVPVVRSEQAFSDLTDIESIEVLRGPQSTLFGKSASAGVINVRTRAPGDEFRAGVRASATTDDETYITASISGPLSDSMGFRLSGHDRNRKDGHVENLLNGTDVDGQQSWGIRARLDWDLADSVTATLFYNHDEAESDCCHRAFRGLDSGALFLGLLPAAFVLGDVEPGADNDQVSMDDPTLTESTSDSGALRIEWDWGEYRFLSVTSLTKWDYEVSTDVDGTSFDLLGLFTGGALSGGINQGGGFDLESWTQELRLVSPASDSFEYVVGVFYSDIEYGRSFRRGPLFGADWLADTGSESLALYGQGTWNLTDATAITAGLRLNREEISHRFNNLLSATELGGDDTETAVPGKISVQHYTSDDVMWFASFAIGYKGQGYDISSSFNQYTSDNPVGSEDSKAFELGMKGTFFDGRLQFNPTAFFARYDDFQAQQARIVGGVVELGIANVGKLETRGIEIDLQALLTENLRLVGGMAYTDAEIKSFSGADCWPGQTAAQGCTLDPATQRSVQDLGGEKLNNSPEFKLTLSAEYRRAFETLPFDGFFNASIQWQSDVNFSLLADPGAEQGAYALVNLSAGFVERDRERYEVSLFVNNLTDENFVGSIGNLGGLWGGSPVYSHFVLRDGRRYGGIRLGLRI